AVLSAGLTFTGRAAAGDLDKFREKQSLAAQKAIKDVKALLAESRTLETKNPNSALDVLRRARTTLDHAQGVSDATRAELQGEIQRRMQSIQVAQSARDAAAKAQADREDIKRREEERRQELNDKRKSGFVDKANDFIKGGKQAIASAYDLKLKKEQGR